MHTDWWTDAAVYQIYPRSFADSNGDGIGDLRGITSRVPYLAALGVNAVWLSPFYPSALADGGYDVDDYRAVDPRLGTLDDFDEMVWTLHAAHIKLIIDIVPNHSSNRHRWFTEALGSSKGSPARERYIFRDGTGPDGSQPPSDWQSIFGGSAWTRVPDGQWYLHMFAPEQPDLNWDNPEVRDDFLTTLRFWSDRAVDGFRVDVAHGLAKDLTEPFLPAAHLPDLAEADGAHPLWDRDEVHDIYTEWRNVFDEYDPPRMAVAEACVHPTRRIRYARADGLGQAFNFDLLEAAWSAEEFRVRINAHLVEAETSAASATWVLSNHDVVRHATRYGLPGTEQTPREVAMAWLLSNGTHPRLDPALGLRRAKAATLLMLALPGSAYLYQGEELGLHEVGDLPDNVLQDPEFHRSNGTRKGRDGCRVPIPWSDHEPSFGFSEETPHLPQPAWFATYAVQAEERDPDSTLELYRRALALRTKLSSHGFTWADEDRPDVLHFIRPGGWHCVANFSPEPVSLPRGTVLVASSPPVDDQLPPETTAWILTSHESGGGGDVRG
ncbi:glycoside hydrolase family 13 protein [Nocardioides sp. NPDC127503]|uniref:glycoside hydrolase family 13 protein n=1 Tax=Nocardioides sp. NPDC127503 TaxID=3154516 RepID=UPI003316A8AA